MIVPGSANPLLLASGATTSSGIGRSLRFRKSASAYLSRTPASAGNRKTWTWSGWVKRGALTTDNVLFRASTSVTGTQETGIIFTSDNIRVLDTAVGVGSNFNLVTNQVFRDVSSWYNVIVAVDTTQAPSSNNIKIYINGAQVTAFSSQNYPSQGYDTAINNNIAHQIGNRTIDYLDGYLADINFIDGLALTPTSFGQFNATTGVWEAKKYTGAYGSNGFRLDFSDNSTAAKLCEDKSGNNNHWTPNNISLANDATYDSMIDVPPVYGLTADVRPKGNYATLNPLGNPNGPITTYSNGNLTWANSASGGNAPKMTVISTIGVTTGKWYFEQTPGSNVNQKIGFSTAIVNGTTSGASYFNYIYDGTAYKSSGMTIAGSLASYTTNNVIGVAIDIDAGTATFYKDGVSQATVSGIPAGTWFAYAEANSSASASGGSFNFGQQPFKHTPPAGFRSLCSTNLPAGHPMKYALAT